MTSSRELMTFSSLFSILIIRLLVVLHYQTLNTCVDCPNKCNYQENEKSAKQKRKIRRKIGKEMSVCN